MFRLFLTFFDKYYGPLSGEKILRGGTISKRSGYFYSPADNSEYAGPVHQHPTSTEQYMEGSEHSDEPHMGLRYVREENNKITSSYFTEYSYVTVQSSGGSDSSETISYRVVKDANVPNNIMLGPTNSDDGGNTTQVTGSVGPLIDGNSGTSTGNYNVGGGVNPMG